MGVRIDAYAVDVPRFEAFVRQPVGRVLRYVAEHGSDREEDLCWLEPEDPVLWWAMPGEGVFRMEGETERRYGVIMDDAESSGIPFLHRTAADFLRGSYSSALYRLLRAITRCPGDGPVRIITEGHRPWWIESLLDAAESGGQLGEEGFKQFRLLWQKVLREYDCGKNLSHATFDPARFDFPILPAEDDQPYIGVWTEDEARFVVECLELLERGPGFRVAPRWARFSDETDDNWDEWVRMMIRQFLAIRDTTDFEPLAVLSFID